jgi:NTE family protein
MESRRFGDSNVMKIGLVLGGGGVVGMAYHAGVLRALEEETGFAPDAADVVVGTSAGSVVGAYLRTGWTTEDFWQLAMGTHPRLEAIGGADPSQARRNILTPAFRSPIDLVRRSVGSAYILGRSVVRVPLPIPAPLAHAFPSGLFAMTEGERRFASELPAAWPEKDLYITAMDIVSGRRITLGRPGSPEIDLPRAVSASCAIPGLYKPVRLGRMTLVDGGVHSGTNLDLATKAGCDLVVAVAPMAYDPASPPAALAQLVRRIPSRSLAAEAAGARRKGVDVVLLRPTASELRLHGLNLMRPDGLDKVAEAAYEATVNALATGRLRDTLEAAA